MQFDAKQVEAIQRCVDINTNNRIVPVTGEPGTGKTSIMKEVGTVLLAAGYRVAFCAPTGKAAKRITELTDFPAMTMHRLLEYPHPGERDEDTGEPLNHTEPRRDQFNPLEYDVVLADEYAMVNHELSRNLINALPRGGCLRVFGDVNQLPPIEQLEAVKDLPTPFKDLLSKFQGITLEHNYRQAEGSGIIDNCLRIKDGTPPQRHEDFGIKITEQPVDALMEAIFRSIENESADFSNTMNQVIAPGVKTWVGTDKLNRKVQTIFRTERDGWLTLPRHRWKKGIEDISVRVGDKVIITENMYDLRPWGERYENPEVNDTQLLRSRPMRDDDPRWGLNGESGIVVEVDDLSGALSIDVGDRVVPVPPHIEYVDYHGNMFGFDPRRNIDLGYVITTHKAQGSEYDNVIYVLNKSSSYNQNRSNYYTAVSRARNKVYVIADQRSFSTSLTPYRRSVAGRRKR